MSNIRGIGDFENRGAAGGGAGYGGGYDGNPAPLGIGLTPAPAYGQIPSISERLLPRFNVKTFTFGISVIEVLLFIATLVYAGVTATVFDKSNAMAGPNSQVLFEMGGKYTPCIVDGQVWRLVTPIFLHAGIVHLVSNLFFQLHFGFTLELRWGYKRFIAVYLVTGIGASLLSSVGSPLNVSVGASGALFGLLGADIAYLLLNWADIPQNSAEMCVLVFVIVINFVFGFSKDSNIDNWAHFGGLITGVFAGAILTPVITPQPKTKLFQGIGTFVWVVLFVTLTLLIFLGAPLPIKCPTS